MLAVCIAAAGVFITLLGLNLLIGNEQIDRRLERTFEVASPWFEHMMGSGLTPARVGGNRVQSSEIKRAEAIARVSGVVTVQNDLRAHAYLILLISRIGDLIRYPRGQCGTFRPA